jgi:hypothetical protein
MKNKEFCSQLSTYFKKRHMGFRSKEDFQTVLRVAGQTETTQQNIQDWLQLDEASDRGRNYCSDNFYLFSSTLPILLKPPFICVLIFFLSGVYFSSLIRITAPPD